MLGGFAFNGYLNGLIMDDSNLFKLQIQYLLQIVYQDALIDALFKDHLDESEFWERSGKVEEGAKVTKFDVHFGRELFGMIAQYLRDQQETMFQDNNLLNCLLLFKKLEDVGDGAYVKDILDALSYISVQYDVFKGTAYDEDRLLTSTQTSMLPVTLAYHAQYQLEQFLKNASQDTRQYACKLLIPQLFVTRNIASIRMLLRIVQQ